MIIYRHNEHGEAVDFIPSEEVPDGWVSLDMERIPEDKSEYHRQEYQVYFDQKSNNKLYLSFLDGTDWLVIRHRDQVELGIQTSLSNEEYQDLLLERQSKRDSITTDT